MADLLYLVHRLPYPPNKGDKVRSYHLFKHLLASHRVHPGAYVDGPDDEQHLPQQCGLCAGLHAELLAADADDDYIRNIDLLQRASDRAASIGTAGRQRVLQTYFWSTHMAVIERNLAGLGAEARAAA